MPHRERTLAWPWILVWMVVLSAPGWAATPWAETAVPPEVGVSTAARLEALEAEVAALRGDAWSEAGCGADCTAAACCESPSAGLYAGFALVLAKPHFKEAFQATVLDGSGVFNMVPFSYDYGATPRVWLGYEGNGGLGLRARYWQFDQAADPFQSPPYTPAQAHSVSVIFPGLITATPPFEVLNMADRLEVHTVDLEGTQAIDVGGIPVTISGGIRYAMMLQQSAASVTGGATVQSLTWQRRFEGVGPTVSVELLRPLGPTSGLAVVGAFRGSLLYGNKDLDRVELNGSGGGPPVVSLDKADEVLGIGEVELGLQWTRPLARGGSLSFRGTYEGQLWSDSGTPTLGYLGFQGFGLAVGLSR